jgi:hypothetical protein
MSENDDVILPSTESVNEVKELYLKRYKSIKSIVNEIQNQVKLLQFELDVNQSVLESQIKLLHFELDVNQSVTKRGRGRPAKSKQQFPAYNDVL